jgi:hypothetical protein
LTHVSELADPKTATESLHYLGRGGRDEGDFSDLGNSELAADRLTGAGRLL